VFLPGDPTLTLLKNQGRGPEVYLLWGKLP
jgi:hypothetical protein